MPLKVLKSHKIAINRGIFLGYEANVVATVTLIF